MDVIAINKLQYLQIGVQGENAANSAPIDMTEWVNEYPDARFHLLFKPYNSTSPLPMVTTYDGETHILTWTPTLGATAVAGVGYTEVRALDVDTGMLKKSRIIPTSVENSVTGVEGGTVPLPYEDWVNLVLSYKDAAEDAQAAAETAQGLAETAQGAAETAESNSEAWAVGQRGGTDVESTDPTYHNNSKYYKGLSEAAKTAAENAQGGAESAEENSEAWAVGKRNGVDVESGDPTYHNNSKYYSEQSSASATSAGNAQTAAETAQGKAEAAQGKAETAQGKAEGWATGGSGGTSSATNNAKYYSEQAASSATSAAASATALDDATASATTLPAGSAATANIGVVGGVKQFQFGIPMGAAGADGADATITATAVAYQESTSGTTIPSGAWSETIPSVGQGNYLWIRYMYTWNSGNTSVNYTVSRMGIDGSGSASAVKMNNQTYSPDAQGVIDIGTVVTDTSGKADKVTGATSGNFAGLDNSGNLTDSGSKASDFLTSHQDISGKADKVSSPTSGNFAGLDNNGNLTDSGSKASDFAAPASVASATLAAGSWTSATPPTQTVNVTGVTASNTIVVSIASTATSAQYEAACNAKILCTAQGAGTITLTCYGDVPAENIPISVVILG